MNSNKASEATFSLTFTVSAVVDAKILYFLFRSFRMLSDNCSIGVSSNFFLAVHGMCEWERATELESATRVDCDWNS